jgi:hypothetical protein
MLSLIWLKRLIFIDITALLSLWFAQIGEIIPSSAWSQYPLLALGAVLAVLLARYWVENERQWREFLRQERVRSEEFLTETMQAQRTSHAEMMVAVGEAQRAAYEEALERFLETTIKLNLYDTRTTMKGSG